MNALGGPLFMMGVLYVMRYVDFSNPKTVFYLKTGYAVMQLGTFLVALLIRERIKKSKELTRITVADPRTNESQSMTAKDYDMSQLKQLLNQTLIGTCITVFLNYKWHVMQPLFIQTVLAPKNMMTNPLFRIYIMGEKAMGKLSRPFKADNPLMDLMKQLQQPNQEPTSQAEGIPDEHRDKKETEGGKSSKEEGDEKEDVPKSSETKKAK